MTDFSKIMRLLAGIQISNFSARRSSPNARQPSLPLDGRCRLPWVTFKTHVFQKPNCGWRIRFTSCSKEIRNLWELICLFTLVTKKNHFRRHVSLQNNEQNICRPVSGRSSASTRPCRDGTGPCTMLSTEPFTGMCSRLRSRGWSMPAILVSGTLIFDLWLYIHHEP